MVILWRLRLGAWALCLGSWRLGAWSSWPLILIRGPYFDQLLLMILSSVPIVSSWPWDAFLTSIVNCFMFLFYPLIVFVSWRLKLGAWGLRVAPEFVLIFFFGLARLAARSAWSCEKVLNFIVLVWCWEHIKDMVPINPVPDPCDWTLVQPIMKLFWHWANFSQGPPYIVLGSAVWTSRAQPGQCPRLQSVQLP